MMEHFIKLRLLKKIIMDTIVFFLIINMLLLV